MNEYWLEITQAGHTLRHDLSGAGLSIGGGASQLALEGVGQDQLILAADPWRVTFKGSGPPPFCGGAPLSTLNLQAGTRIEWAGIRIEFREHAVLQELGQVDQAAPSSAGAPGTGLDAMEEIAWLRLRAGLLVDTGQVKKSQVEPWQQQVLDGVFDVSGCAADLNASVQVIDQRLADRAGRLMRDFVMASKLQGAAGAARATRTATKSFVSMLIAQGMALGIYSLVLFGCMIFIRQGGTSFDGLFDSILGLFGMK